MLHKYVFNKYLCNYLKANVESGIKSYGMNYNYGVTLGESLHLFKLSFIICKGAQK